MTRKKIKVAVLFGGKLAKHDVSLMPADLPKSVVKKIQAMALRVFEALTCEGLGRVDFF